MRHSVVQRNVVSLQAISEIPPSTVDNSMKAALCIQRTKAAYPYWIAVIFSSSCRTASKAPLRRKKHGLQKASKEHHCVHAGRLHSTTQQTNNNKTIKVKAKVELHYGIRSARPTWTQTFRLTLSHRPEIVGVAKTAAVIEPLALLIGAVKEVAQHHPSARTGGLR